jgi:hypothetical protein
MLGVDGLSFHSTQWKAAAVRVAKLIAPLPQSTHERQKVFTMPPPKRKP